VAGLQVIAVRMGRQGPIRAQRPFLPGFGTDKPPMVRAVATRPTKAPLSSEGPFIAPERLAAGLEEIVAVVLYLASTRRAFVTGHAARFSSMAGVFESPRNNDQPEGSTPQPRLTARRIVNTIRRAWPRSEFPRGIAV